MWKKAAVAGTILILTGVVPLVADATGVTEKNMIIEKNDSIQMFGISKDEADGNHQNGSESSGKEGEQSVTDAPEAPSLELKITDENDAKIISYNGGMGYINGKPISNHTRVRAVGIYFVAVVDKNANRKNECFFIQPRAVSDPLTAYTPLRCEQEIESLSALYPDLIKCGTIGKSTQGMDIPYFTIGKGSKKILFVGSCHAREHMTTAYLMYMADMYAMAYYSGQKIDGKDVSQALNQATITIVPMMNPDGVSFVVEGYENIPRQTIEARFGVVPEEVRMSWKETITGTNLNRNFPFYWNKNIAAQRGFLKDITGDGPASEPETKALMDFCNSQQFDFALACHSKGEVLYWRDEKNGVVNGDELLARTVSAVTGYKMAKTTQDPAMYGGGFENWFRHAFKKPAVCIEFTPHDGKEEPHDNADFFRLIWDKASSLGIVVTEI